MVPLKDDWKLFRSKVALWQEAYMEMLIKDYETLLLSDAPASSKFWALEKRIKLDKHKPGVMLNLNKEQMMFDIARLIHDGVISLTDYSDFSDGLIEAVKGVLSITMADSE